MVGSLSGQANPLAGTHLGAGQLSATQLMISAAPVARRPSPRDRRRRPLSAPIERRDWNGLEASLVEQYPSWPLEGGFKSCRTLISVFPPPSLLLPLEASRRAPLCASRSRAQRGRLGDANHNNGSSKPGAILLYSRSRTRSAPTI